MQTLGKWLPVSAPSSGGAGTLCGGLEGGKTGGARASGLCTARSEGRAPGPSLLACHLLRAEAKGTVEAHAAWGWLGLWEEARKSSPFPSY